VHEQNGFEIDPVGCCPHTFAAQSESLRGIGQHRSLINSAGPPTAHPGDISILRIRRRFSGRGRRRNTIGAIEGRTIRANRTWNRDEGSRHKESKPASALHTRKVANPGYRRRWAKGQVHHREA